MNLLENERVVLIGKLAGMSRREATRLIRAQGAELVDSLAAAPTLAVLGEEQGDFNEWLEQQSAEMPKHATSVPQVLSETELWSRLGLVDSGEGVHHLYTPSMLGELLQVPTAVIRRWHRRGHLHAVREVKRLAYFDFREVAIARQLTELLSAGCSLATIDRRLDSLALQVPHLDRPLAELTVVIRDGQIFLRQGDELTEPTGQMLFAFDEQDESEEILDQTPVESILSIDSLEEPHQESSATAGDLFEEIRSRALEWEENGELLRAADAYRTLLAAGTPTAEDNFVLAELLYRMNDLSASRERYYMAIELDTNYVEARANLGCVLAENGELELAEAAFRGALDCHHDYADVYYHLAQVLTRLKRTDEAAGCWQAFLNLAPESPWAEEARQQLSIEPVSSSTDC